jgi:hypothetical protein
MSTESSTGESGTTDSSSIGKHTEWSILNWIVIGVFAVLTFVGIVLSTGAIGWIVAIPSETGGKNPVTVPLFVYRRSRPSASG